jgi:hypothetical protein
MSSDDVLSILIVHSKSKKEVLTFIREGGMMKCPEHCPPEVCDIMKSCWCKGPKDRPAFLDLKELLVTLVM